MFQPVADEPMAKTLRLPLVPPDSVHDNGERVSVSNPHESVSTDGMTSAGTLVPRDHHN